MNTTPTKSAALLGQRTFLTVATAALVLCVVTVPSPSFADTYKDKYGITWTYTVTSGSSVTLTAVDDKEAIFNAADFPWTFSNGGTDYTVTALGANLCQGWKSMFGTLTIPSAVKTLNNFSFDNCDGLTALAFEEGVTSFPYRAFYSSEHFTGSLIIPHSVVSIASQAFLWAPLGVTSIWIKGPEAVDSGTQGYTVIACQTGNIFFSYSNLGLKVALFGPYVRPGGTMNKVLNVLDNCIVYLPRNGYWKEADEDTHFGGTKTILYYGEGEELDISIDETKNVLSATVNSVNALTNVLKSAAVFKSDFGLDTKISVTNAFDMSEVDITDEMAKSITFDSLTFSVKNQTQLDNVLKAIPENLPVTIDPKGLTESLEIKEDRPVFVKSGIGYDVEKLKKGLVIILM